MPFADTFRGLRTFFPIWLSQVVSLLGSQLTNFAIGIWVYQQTGEVTSYALVFAFAWLPGILLSPFVGVLADRWDRRLILIFSDLGAGVTVLVLSLLFFSGRIEVWHVYLMVLANASFSAFQLIVLPATVPLIVTKEHLGRANGMLQLGLALGQISGPILAGFLIDRIGFAGVILIDFSTLMLAVTVMSRAKIPKPEAGSEHLSDDHESSPRQISFGLRYLWAHPGLLALSLYFAAINFTIAMIQVLVTPLVLSFADVQTLGTVLSFGGTGMLIGGVLMSVWGGPRRRIRGILLFGLLQGTFLVVGGLRPSVPLVMGAIFGVLFCTPIIIGCSQVIWQTRVASVIQGRVFAARHMIASATQPIGILLAGPLADDLFEPLLLSGGALTPSLGAWIGVGPGRGTALLVITLGLLTLLCTLAASVYPRLRRLERELPERTETADAP